MQPIEEPIEVGIASHVIAVRAETCPSCGFDSLEHLLVVVEVMGMPQEVVPHVECGRCGHLP